jgi:hypothetical protein
MHEFIHLKAKKIIHQNQIIQLKNEAMNVNYAVSQTSELSDAETGSQSDRRRNKYSAIFKETIEIGKEANAQRRRRLLDSADAVVHVVIQAMNVRGRMRNGGVQRCVLTTDINPRDHWSSSAGYIFIGCLKVWCILAVRRSLLPSAMMSIS